MQTFETPGSVSLQIKLPSGRVVVTTVDEPKTTVEVVARGRRGQDAIDEIDITMHESAGRHELRIEQKDKFRWGPIQITWGGDFECRVTCPPGADLEFGGGSTDLRVEGELGEVAVSTASGDIRLQSTRGDLQVKTASGDVSVATVAGEATLVTVSGDVDVARVDGALTVRAVSGDVTIGAIDSEWASRRRPATSRSAPSVTATCESTRSPGMFASELPVERGFGSMPPRSRGSSSRSWVSRITSWGPTSMPPSFRST